MTKEKITREAVRKWLLDNPEETEKVLAELAEEREKQALRAKIAALEKELKAQAISFGKKSANSEKEKNELRAKLGMPVTEKPGQKKRPAKLSERLEEAGG